MPSARIVKDSKINRSSRVMQMEGIFDISPIDKSRLEWNVDFEFPKEWNIGLIVGPSGSGKTVIANELFGDSIVPEYEWSKEKSIIDDFPQKLGVKDIIKLLSSVGFSSPPAWVRPYHVLSNGEKFRASIARTMAEDRELAVVDEFTSVVDRTVAKIGSAAIAKVIRKRNQKFIAVSCHEDIAEWLEPDWVFEPATNTFKTVRLRRPEIKLEVKRVHRSAWELFRKHHYLEASLNKAAKCFVAFWEGVPTAFIAVLHFPHPSSKKMKKGHRVVCLPDFQGVGIGSALNHYIGSILKALKFRYRTQASHPAIIAVENKNPNWAMTRKPARMGSRFGKTSSLQKFGPAMYQPSVNRVTASFEYIGKAANVNEAKLLWGAA